MNYDVLFEDELFFEEEEDDEYPSEAELNQDYKKYFKLNLAEYGRYIQTGINKRLLALARKHGDQIRQIFATEKWIVTLKEKASFVSAIVSAIISALYVMITTISKKENKRTGFVFALLFVVIWILSYFLFFKKFFIKRGLRALNFKIKKEADETATRDSSSNKPSTAEWKQLNAAVSAAVNKIEEKKEEIVVTANNFWTRFKNHISNNKWIYMGILITTALGIVLYGIFKKKGSSSPEKDIASVLNLRESVMYMENDLNDFDDSRNIPFYIIILGIIVVVIFGSLIYFKSKLKEKMMNRIFSTVKSAYKATDDQLKTMSREQDAKMTGSVKEAEPKKESIEILSDLALLEAVKTSLKRKAKTVKSKKAKRILKKAKMKGLI